MQVAPRVATILPAGRTKSGGCRKDRKQLRADANSFFILAAVVLGLVALTKMIGISLLDDADGLAHAAHIPR
jgi:hypothetical protein